MPIVAGIVLAAVGDELVIAHPGHHASLFAAFAITGGPAVYLLGHLLFRLRMVHSTARSWIVALVVLVALVPFGTALPMLALAGITTAVLAGLLIYEARRLRATEHVSS